MTPPTTGTDYIVEELAAISGVMRDDIHVSGDTVTTYVPTDQLEDAEAVDDIDIEVLKEHEHEYLISAKTSQ
jgi:hypothetical protein